MSSTAKVLLVTLSVVSLPAVAQCTKDTDCKGERICVGGECVAPQPGLSPVPASEPGAPSARDWSSRPMLTAPNHWARAAGVVGIITGALVLGFGTVAALTTGETLPSIGTGAFAFLAAAIGGPIVAVGAASARFAPGLGGSPGARIAGWIGYGVAMALGAAMLIVGFIVTFPAPLVLSVAVLGATSLVCLAADAFVSAAQAEAWASSSGADWGRRALLPLATLVRRPDGSAVPVVGLAGTF